MLPHTVFVYRKIGTDSYNQAVYDAAVSHQARVVYGLKLVKSRTGELVPSSGSIWMFSSRALHTEDKFEFLSEPDPSPQGYTQLFPLAIDTFPDDTGMYHNKVYFQ